MVEILWFSIFADSCRNLKKKISKVAFGSQVSQLILTDK